MGVCFFAPRQHGTHNRPRLPVLRPTRLSKLFRSRKRQMEEAEMAERVNDEVHKHFMREAIQMVLSTSATMNPADRPQAETALRTDETPVGCVFVHDGEVIARGMNDTNKSLNVSVHVPITISLTPAGNAARRVC